MAELFDAVASWESFLLVLLVFGIAPGTVLRLFVRCYPKDDPQRRALIADLYVVPRLERPLWVAEQMETAVFEGWGLRLRARRASDERQQMRSFALGWFRGSCVALVAVTGATVAGVLPIWAGIVLSLLLAALIWWTKLMLRVANVGIEMAEQKALMVEIDKRLDALERRLVADTASLRRVNTGLSRRAS